MKKPCPRPIQSMDAARGGVARRASKPPKAEMIEHVDRSPGFFASLTDEQWEAIESYDGPEALGGE